ncbi:MULTISPECIES: hypothetical protein [unclassified Mycolicibacterium]|uniref:hypothetical protein n=1 Tax=unclassified Mycolicibacterium TaxID=2636767 RepID=UPI0012DDF78C|nr:MULTISPECIES: hypothetical protein [unclassified Mycolicibacterium]
MIVYEAVPQAECVGGDAQTNPEHLGPDVVVVRGDQRVQGAETDDVQCRDRRGQAFVSR